MVVGQPLGKKSLDTWTKAGYVNPPTFRHFFSRIRLAPGRKERIRCPPRHGQRNFLMKKKLSSQSGFSGLHVLLGLVLGSIGVLLGLIGFGISSGTSALAISL